MSGEADRDLPASARRLQKAREQGDVPQSRELGLLAGLGVGAALLWATLPGATASFVRLLAAALAHPDQASVLGLPLLRMAAWLALPTAGSALTATLLAAFLQTGFLLRMEGIRLDAGRISPLAGIRRLLGTDGLIAAGRATAKLVLLVAVAGRPMRHLAAVAGAATALPPGRLLGAIGNASLGLALPLLGVQAAFALADLALVRWQHARKHRMTRQEQRDETRESEGNPEVKGRLRQIARSRARRRMMAAVPRATVVVTNPTHYAIALAYQRGAGGAPRVVAKGVDEIAWKIREIARENTIPLVANPPLARALYSVELEQEIPAEHFRAVAEIIAFVWRMRARPRVAPPG